MKKAKNLKQRTINDYIVNMNYFVEWMQERYGNVLVHDITSSLLREYILWCSSEKDYYGGHPFKEDYAAGKKGLWASSVNVRIQIIKTSFSELYSWMIQFQLPLFSSRIVTS
jgi:integrase/recombinase XerD